MKSSIHLNLPDGAAPLFNRLNQEIGLAKQGRASGKQWLAFIKGLAQKGVKSAELSDIRLDSWLDGRGDDMITREELLAHLGRITPTIKELVADRPKYKGWVQPGGAYEEIYYVLASEKDRMADRLEEVEHEMQLHSLDAASGDLGTDLDVIEQRIVALESERAALFKGIPDAYDFTAHHWSGELELKNLLAHARVTTFPDGTYFIQEIQSDWAQHGRRCDFKSPAFPPGPLVTSTEAWAGMVLRRQLQRAARNPEIRRIAWMTESMRNGAIQDVAAEAAKAEQARQHAEAAKLAASEFLEGKALPEDKEERKALEVKAREHGELVANGRGLRIPADMLNDFYLRVLVKMADKLLGNTGKMEMQDVDLAGRPARIPCVELTAAVREKLGARLPVYSLARVNRQSADENDERFQAALRNARQMLGDLAQVRLLKRVWDLSTGNQASGATVHRLIEISLAARDPVEVMDHECMHFAMNNLLDQREVAMLRRAFAVGSPLHRKVCDLALLDGETRLAGQCQRDCDEAIAQGFAYWAAERLHVDEAPRGVFARIAEAFRVVGQWIRKAVDGQSLQTVDEVFAHLTTGHLAAREADARRVTTLRASPNAHA